MTHEQALHALRKGRPDEALRLWAAIAEAGGADAYDARGHRAWNLRAMGRYEEALAEYDAMLAAAPGDLTMRSVRASVLLRLNRLEEASRAAAEVLREEPLQTEALGVLAAIDRRLPRLAGGSEQRGEASAVSSDSGAINPVVAQLERDTMSFPTSVFPEIGRFLYGLARIVQPRLAVETGTFIGYSSLCIAQALDDADCGHLHTFDLFIDRPGYVSPVLGPTPDSLQAARGHAERAGLADRISFHKGDSAEGIGRILAPAAASSEAPAEAIDFAFIDGDHTVEGCLRDWRIVDRHLRPGGIVALHDTMPHDCGWYGPRYLLEELQVRVEQDYHWINVPTPAGHGVAVIQKKSDAPAPTWKPPLLEIIRDRIFVSLKWHGRGKA